MDSTAIRSLLNRNAPASLYDLIIDLMNTLYKGEGSSKFGDVLINAINSITHDQSICRKLMCQVKVPDGATVRFPVTVGDTLIQAKTASPIESELASDKFYVPSTVLIASRTSSSFYAPLNSYDNMYEFLIDNLEGTMVLEDRLWVNMARYNKSIELKCPLTFIKNSVLELKDRGLKVSNVLLDEHVYLKLAEDYSFLIDYNDEEKVLNGRLGKIGEINLLTDMFRSPRHKILNQGEMFIVGEDIKHGYYSTTKLQHQFSDKGEPTHILSQEWSAAITNSRSVIQGQLTHGISGKLI